MVCIHGGKALFSRALLRKIFGVVVVKPMYQLVVGYTDYQISRLYLSEEEALSVLLYKFLITMQWPYNIIVTIIGLLEHKGYDFCSTYLSLLTHDSTDQSRHIRLGRYALQKTHVPGSYQYRR